MKLYSKAVLICVHIIFLLQFVQGYSPVAKKLTNEKIAEFEGLSNENPDVHHIKLDPDGKYEFSWEYDNDSITFNATVDAIGWIGLGFSPTSGMTDADIVFIWIDDTGKGHISDRHATANQYPEKDALQDYTILEARKNESKIQARFRRLRDTCDSENDYQLTADSTRIIYAFSDVQPADDAHFEKHLAMNRGIKGIFLFDPPDVRVRLPADTITLEFLADSVRLPTDHHMMYWCQVFELPRWPVHHLIRLEPIVVKENERYVHHVAVYQCSRNMSAYADKGERCFVGDGFNFSKSYECTSRIIWFWNPGMKPTDFPNDIGLPLFESLADSYILLEVHYENLGLKPGIIDHSGFRMYLTPTPRPIEAGLMFLGTPEQAPNQILPPGDLDFRFYAHFEKCLAYLPKSGVKMLYTLLHQHLYGKRIRMHHYRNGVQLPDYGIDDNYNFYAQEFRLVDPPRLVLPGDELVLECIYNTSETNKTIYGGYSTLDEMCIVSHFYYPRVARGFSCHSYPDPQIYVPIFGGKLVDNSTVYLPSNETVTLYEFVKQHLDWNKPNVHQEYKALVSNGQYVQNFVYQPLKNAANSSHSNEGTDPPFELHALTHNGYPKVTHPWIPELAQDRNCSHVLHEQATEKAATQIPTVHLTEGSHASKIFQLNRIIFALFCFVIYYMHVHVL